VMKHDDEDDDTQIYADTLLIVYQQGFADGKRAAQRQWVGLTDEEASWCQAPSTIQTWKRIEAKLKEKNT